MSFTRVTVSELQSAAARFSQSNQTMREAAAALKAAADALADTWEGEAHDVFVNEQQRINQWYETMFEVIDGFVAAMNQASVEYVNTDQMGAQRIKNS